jgi:hypothetical protein
MEKIAVAAWYSPCSLCPCGPVLVIKVFNHGGTGTTGWND